MYWLLIIGLIIVLIVIHNKLFPPESQNRQNDRYLRKRKPAKFDSRCSSRAAHTLQSWSQTKQSSGKSVSANSAKNKKQPYSLYEDPYALKITIRLPSKASAKAPSDKPTIFRPQQNTTVAEHKPHQPATNNVHQLPTGPAARQQQTIQPQPAKPKYYSPVPEDIVQPQRTQHDELEQRKPDWYAIKMVLDMHDIHYLYHFTDRRNIPSIKRHGGLLSWYYCLTHNIVIPNPGGTEISRRLDERYDLEDYVRLSFCSDHPMAYGLKISGAEVVVLQIIADVALLKDTMFSDINATDSIYRAFSCPKESRVIFKLAELSTYAGFCQFSQKSKILDFCGIAQSTQRGQYSVILKEQACGQGNSEMEKNSKGTKV